MLQKLAIPLFVTIALLGALPVQAHRSGCHRWHSCPSDRGTYICGDWGYPCRYSTYNSRDGYIPPYVYQESESPDVDSIIMSVLANSDVAVVPARINALFHAVYGRNPTPSENQYWLSRIPDKPTNREMVNAMKWHKINGVEH